MITLKTLLESVRFETENIDISLWDEEKEDRECVASFWGEELNDYMLSETKPYWNCIVNYLDTYISYGKDCLTIEIIKLKGDNNNG